MPKQPADFLVLYRGRHFLIEAKSRRNATSFDMDGILPHQLASGLKWEKAGGTYYFILCKRVPFKMLCYVVPAPEIPKIRKGMKTKRYAKWGMIEEHAIATLDRNTKSKVWEGLKGVLE